jgi:hypothetical protein
MGSNSTNEPRRDDEQAGSVESGSVPGKKVRDAPFPHREIPADAGDERNADVRPKAPQGPQRGPSGPTERKTGSSPADDAS